MVGGGVVARQWNGNTANRLEPLANLHGDNPSVAAWVNLHTYAANHSTTRPAAGQWDAGGKCMMLFVNYLGFAGYEVVVPPLYSVSGATTIALDTWYHLCGTFDGVVRIYVNGVLDGSLVGAPFGTATGGTWRIGYSSAGPWVWDGKIAEVGHWSRALSAAEVAALAAGVSPARIPAGLLSYVPVYGQESPELDLRRGAAVNIAGTLPAVPTEPGRVGSPWSAAG